MTISKKELSAEQLETLLFTLKARFEKNTKRHKGIEWKAVLAKLDGNSEKIWSLHEMERTGGEPDLVVFPDSETTPYPAGDYLFIDCSAESPSGRRSLCFDQAALDSRKENKPAGSAMEMAKEMGIELLNEASYRALQQLGAFDLKTSSWIITPPEIRALGGAFFCDRRYNHVFLYHNGASSYYAARAFRGCIWV